MTRIYHSSPIQVSFLTVTNKPWNVQKEIRLLCHPTAPLCHRHRNVWCDSHSMCNKIPTYVAHTHTHSHDHTKMLLGPSYYGRLMLQAQPVWLNCFSPRMIFYNHKYFSASFSSRRQHPSSKTTYRVEQVSVLCGWKVMNSN